MLSTTSSAPASCATAAVRSMSVMFSSGLLGVSHQTTRVVGRIAARSASGSSRSTGVYSSPHSDSTREISRKVPP